jgi:hypothetical protein
MSAIDESFVVDRPVSDLELLLCHGIPLKDQECGDLILIAVRSSDLFNKAYFCHKKPTFDLRLILSLGNSRE